VYDAYVNDDWRVSPSLTLNMGMRWEYGAPITEKYGRLVNLDVARASRRSRRAGVQSHRKPHRTALRQLAAAARSQRLLAAPGPFLASDAGLVDGHSRGLRPQPDTSVYLPIASRMAQQSPLSTTLSLNNQQNPLTLANAFFLAPNVTTNTFAVDRISAPATCRAGRFRWRAICPGRWS